MSHNLKLIRDFLDVYYNDGADPEKIADLACQYQTAYEERRQIKNTNLLNRLLARKPYSDNPRDGYLEIVLLEVSHVVGSPSQYTTHVWNKSDDSIAHGHYFDNVVNAVNDFNKREY